MHGLLLPVWVFVSFMLAQVLVAAVVRLIQALGVSFTSVNEIIFNSAVTGIVYAVTIALVVGVPWLVRKQRTSANDLGLQRAPDWLDIFAAPAGGVVYIILTALVAAFAMAFLPFVDYNQVQETGFSGINTQLEYILAFLSLVIIAPFAEELLFRGYLLGKLRRAMPLWIAVLITSVLFALVHFQWNVALDVFALSIVLCVLRVMTKSLWAPILLHSLKNGLAFYLLFINPIAISTIGG